MNVFRDRFVAGGNSLMCRAAFKSSQRKVSSGALPGFRNIHLRCSLDMVEKTRITNNSKALSFENNLKYLYSYDIVIVTYKNTNRFWPISLSHRVKQT